MKDNQSLSGNCGTLPVLILFGPTASGKSKILLELFELADDPRAEIISADSMQVYCGMDIGTAKPSYEDRIKLPHHLIDIRLPSQQFNVGDFVRLAQESCMEISGRGRLPVISGGTGFYLKNFILGLSEAPPSDNEVRIQIKKELNENGAAFLVKQLTACDPVSAARIHINDEYRLLRAIEVFRISGKPLSSFTAYSSNVPDNSSSANRQKHNLIIVGLSRPREELYKRINLRCESMFKMGLADEVRKLYGEGYTPDDPGLRAIGYREFFIEDAEIKGKWKLSQDTQGVKSLIEQNSRRYAKRQITFFKNIPNVKWIECDDDEKKTVKLIEKEIIEIYKK